MTFRALWGSLWACGGLCGPLFGWHVTNKAQHGQTWRQSLIVRRQTAVWRRWAGSGPAGEQVTGKRSAFHAFTGGGSCGPRVVPCETCGVVACSV